MPKKKPAPTIEDLKSQVRKDLDRWHYVHKHGTSDPNWEDGANLHLIRNHIMFGQEALRELCKAQDKKCPREATLKVPKEVSWTYCARKSKAGPCKARRTGNK